MDRPVIYTIGHSTHPIDVFFDLLTMYSINCVIDVRSVAASKYNPQYNKKALSDFLTSKGVVYMHFADEFGARQTNPALLDEHGKVDFERVRGSAHFKNGVGRLRQGIEKGFCITLMCAESEPFDCHRFSMISVGLEKEGFEVQHILKDKMIKTNAQLEDRLLKKFEKKLPQPDVFQPNITIKEQLKIAYRLRNREIGFSPYSKESSEVDF